MFDYPVLQLLPKLFIDISFTFFTPYVIVALFFCQHICFLIYFFCTSYSHTASIAAGNHGIPVVVAGHHFGNASGMAPRAQ